MGANICIPLIHKGLFSRIYKVLEKHNSNKIFQLNKLFKKTLERHFVDGDLQMTSKYLKNILITVHKRKANQYILVRLMHASQKEQDQAILAWVWGKRNHLYLLVEKSTASRFLGINMDTSQRTSNWVSTWLNNSTSSHLSCSPKFSSVVTVVLLIVSKNWKITHGQNQMTWEKYNIYKCFNKIQNHEVVTICIKLKGTMLSESEENGYV